MRILEETKNYIIYYKSDPILFDNKILAMFGFLIDKKSKIEYCHYEKCNDNNLHDTVMKLGKKLLKRYKKVKKCRK